MHLPDWSSSLFAVAFGWLLGELTQRFTARREEKKAIGRALSDLLEIRHRLLAFPKIAEILSTHFGLLPANQIAVKVALTRLFPADADLSKRYAEAVTMVAAVNPLLGFRLRSQDMISPLFERLREIALAGDPSAADALTGMEDGAIEHVKPHLEILITEIAWMQGWTTWLRVKRYLSRPLALPEGMLQSIRDRFPPVDVKDSAIAKAA